MTKILRTDVTYNDSVISTKAVIDYAIDNSLDISMLCSSLRGSLRDDLYKESGGSLTFADHLNKYLKNKDSGEIRILIWNEKKHSIISNPLASLFSKYANLPADKKKLAGCISGTTVHSEIISHFIVAHDRSGEIETSVMRLEQPHSIITDYSPIDGNTNCPPAVLFASTLSDDLVSESLSFFESAWMNIGLANGMNHNAAPADLEPNMPPERKTVEASSLACEA
jgi:hypothetical protein